MKPEEVLALSGTALDAAVHRHVFQRKGKPAAYSTAEGDAFTLIDRLPLFVGRVPDNHPKFDADRPFVAGTLQHEPAVKGDITALRITAARPLVALCKAALLLVFRSPQPNQLGARPAPRARARGRSATAAPVAPVADPRSVAARIGTSAARRPFAQPAVGIHSRDARQPMPKRPQNFVGPTPQPPGNR